MDSQTTLGLIVGNRGFFPSHLCEEGRADMIRVLQEEGFKVIALGPEDTEYGSVESLSDARKCADLFKAHADEISGIVVTLPNFGDERAVANTIRFSGLDVPVLVQATPDVVGKMDIKNRRDSFCGKMSVCNNLTQYGIPYSLTTLHTVAPDSGGFRADVREFAAVCRVVKGMKGARFGMLGARPSAFKTVRFSEKLFERAGISVETLDLSDAYGRAEALGDDDPDVKAKRAAIEAYAQTTGVPGAALNRMARFGVVIDRWVEEEELDATAIQCWTSLEEYFGIVPCTLMSMMSNRLAPSACETDITGLAGMYAMALASGKPSMLLDWNNNYGDDPDKGVVFHCSNLPADVLISDIPVMSYQEIIAGSVGKENTFGAICGRIKAGPFTFCRVATDDVNGTIKAYIGEGRFTDDVLDTFGGAGVVEIENFQDLLYNICIYGWEHHVAANLSQVSEAVAEAMDKYMGWDVYYHE